MLQANTRARRLPQQERSVATYDAILDAVSLLAAESGLEAVTARQVLKRAGVAPGTLYQYFESREAVIAAWEQRELERRGTQFGELARRIVDESPNSLEAIRGVVRAGIESIDAHMAYYREREIGARFFGRAEVTRRLADVVRTMLASRRQRPCLPDLTFAIELAVVSTISAGVSLARETRPSAEREAFIDQLGDMVGRFLMGTPVSMANTPA